VTDRSSQTEQHPAASKVLPSGVEIASIAVRGLRYYEDAGPNSKTKLDEKWPEAGGLNFIGKLRLISAESAEFSIWVRARLESGDSIFGVYVGLSAMFSRQAIIEARPFISFINRQGAPILYPYVREIITSVSARTIYGPIVLPPLIIAPLIDDETIDNLVRNLEVMIAATTGQNESVQVSEVTGTT
jgi:preprotein translocase subunit SecB